ncbi:lipid A deacylase LpxR family protein [Pedobacter sp. SD-b]|uniref:Lipid A deacylase LpxR family protein n=1 Tax=Pedobacter segetis TaxID=2793069 RepID=A0ABS1BM84_9SPHI|nr:lipid A deacylase LpxR family protein [Pedobacter segetis]MBK0383856.1 lipid A deacylase LpxR family protein [Pedobacter segetis]
MQNSLKLSISVLFIFISLSGYSQIKSYQNELGFKSENDSYLGTGQDRYYTNGLFITYKRASKTKNYTDSLDFTKKIWSASIGQYMYNAQSGQITDIKYVDRPFAAYLYGAFALQYLNNKEHTVKFELQLGTIGPNALGLEAQEVIHKTFGFYDIKGWEYQVKNEIGFNAKADILYLIHRSGNKRVDFSLPLEGRLGNTFTSLSAGLLFRTGSLNPLYHSVATQSNVSNFKEAGVLEKEFYFFLKPQLQLVIYDATIAGGLFRTDKGPVTFKTNPLVFSQELGLAYAKKRWTVDFSVIFKTKEESSMVFSHQYGSFDLYYRF